MPISSASFLRCADFDGRDVAVSPPQMDWNGRTVPAGVDPTTNVIYGGIVSHFVRYDIVKNVSKHTCRFSPFA